MSDYDLPPGGFLVVCMATGRYIIVASNLDHLAKVVGNVHDEAAKKYPDTFTPIQCFELGRELQVSLEYRVQRIAPKDDKLLGKGGA